MCGALLMFISAGLGYWLTHAPMFDVNPPTSVPVLTYVSAGTLLASAGLTPDTHTNAFLLRTSEIRDRLLGNADVAGAQVSVSLPDTVQVDMTERQPAFVLQRPDGTYLVGSDGVVLATTDVPVPPGTGIPTIVDNRTQFPPVVAVGAELDQIDLAAMLQLGAITPSLIDSTATSLALTVGDDDGYVLTAQPQGWQAIFGEYTSSLRPTDLIPRQVQCLRSLLGASESDVTTIYLSPMDERCGTYLPVGTPVPIITPHPTDTPKPAR